MKLLSIRTHLFLRGLAMAIPLVAAVALAIYVDMQNSIALTKSSLLALSNTMVANTGRTIQSTRAMLEAVARRPQVRQLDPKHCDAILQDIQSLRPGIVRVAYARRDGTLVCSAPAAAGGAKLAPGVGGQPLLWRDQGRLSLILSAPVPGERNTLAGQVQLTMALDELDPAIPAQLLPPESRYGFFQSDGIMVWRNIDPERVIGTRPNADAARRIVAARNGQFESLAVDGVTRFFSVASMPETGWIAFVGLPASTVYGPPAERALRLGGLALAAMLLLLLCGTLIARRITRPIAELEHCARAVHQGDLTVRAVVAGPAEVMAVAQELNAMIAAQQASNVELRIAAATFESHQGMLVTDAQGVILKVNKTFSEMSGYSADDAIGRMMDFLNSDRRDDGLHAALLDKVRSDGSWEGETWNRMRDGELRAHWVTISAVTDHGVVTNYVAAYTDITERKQMEDQVRHLAFYDALTSLPNRRLLNDRLAQALASVRRNGCHGALLFLDLDNFKPINDQYGHGVGDLLLVEAAGRLKGCVREVDTVGRFGGDEFVVLLSELSDDHQEAIAQAMLVAEKVRHVVSQPYLLTVGRDNNGADVIHHCCTTSIGVAMFNGHEASQDDILKWADSAMYAAKALGRNAIHLHDEGTVRQRLRLVD